MRVAVYIALGGSMNTRTSKLARALVFTTLGGVACAEDDDAVVQDTPSDFEIEGVGPIQYGSDVRVVATVTLPTRGAVHFFESGSEEGHGCAGFFPGDAPGDPSATMGRDGCLPTFLALTAPDTPIPAALLVGSEDYVETIDREVVDVVGEVFTPPNLPLAAPLDPLADEIHDVQLHTCSGSGGDATHWQNVHCDQEEFGAEHCDPFLQGGITISSGVTYRGSFMSGLFCANTGGQTTHFYWNGSSWVSTVEFNHGPFSGTYNFFSRWSGAAPWRRRITSTEDGAGAFRHYTVMCPGLVCAGDF